MSDAQLAAHLAKMSRFQMGINQLTDPKAPPPPANAVTVNQMPLDTEAQEQRKFKNVKTTRHGIEFDSIHEANCYDDLKLRERAGEITHINRQVTFPLVVNGSRIQRWRADFTLMEYCGTGDKSTGQFAWHFRVVDAKSQYMRERLLWIRTKKLFEALYGLSVTLL